MGGFDVYCAICGSTFQSESNLSIDSDDETDQTYSGEVIGESDLTWLQTLRALGLNADIPGERKSFITGQGYCKDAGFIVADRGDDPNVPYDAYFCAYYGYRGMEDRVVFPFHEVCYKDILLRCFENEKIRGDVLYALCEEMSQDRGNGLAWTCGDPMPPCDQYWECRKGEEILVTHPVKIPQLASYSEEIKELLVDVEKKSPESRAVKDTHDIFDKLPFELRQTIFDLLPIGSVLALKAASCSMHACPYGSWKQRLEIGMPWFWEVRDIDPFKSQALEARLSRMIVELEKKSQYKAGPVDYIPGLANRRRIWAICEDIKALYHDKLAEAEGHHLDSTAKLAALRAFFASFRAENPNPRNI
ncbi:hypothetical protein N7510_009104 [Penicillium lagena]|uniref:uncharacterized protein n=1 Tax=Penicillium lagena TaxID=94218 RepID=UPI00253FBD89|nr:uncharacterized protein N7510_009104 [Penicillium lagena]KAJ5606323.1 hypothetical protein N7510_009104 [Penicillium lagena]